MKQKWKKIGALYLLVLFVAYQASMTAFTHVHYINGVLITHSHPFQGSHSHSKTALVVIGQLPTLCSPELQEFENLHPMRALLAVLQVEPATPTVKGDVLRTLSLRAPPATSFHL